MKIWLLKILSYLALAGTLIPSILVFAGIIDLQTNKNIMAVSMAVWFLTAPFWINKKSDETIETIL